LQQGLARGDALRRAQLTLMRKTGRQHPFYWASYIQSGDWKRLDDK
jgi:CHAT domain-containing protein